MDLFNRLQSWKIFKARVDIALNFRSTEVSWKCNSHCHFSFHYIHDCNICRCFNHCFVTPIFILLHNFTTKMDPTWVRSCSDIRTSTCLQCLTLLVYHVMKCHSSIHQNIVICLFFLNYLRLVKCRTVSDESWALSTGLQGCLGWQKVR